MKCKHCPAGRRTIRNEHRCVNCLLYGIVMKEDHECTREGWRDYDRIIGQGGGEMPGETEVQANSGGVVIPLPGVL